MSPSTSKVNSLPCELMADIMSLCTNFDDLLKLSTVSRSFYETFESLKPAILCKVTKNIVGSGKTFDYLIEVLKYQRHSRAEILQGFPSIVVNYHKVKPSLSQGFSFTLEDAKNVKKNQEHFEMVQQSFGPSLTAIHRLDIRNSSFSLKQIVPIGMFYELWVTALRFGWESLADWSLHPEHAVPEDEQKMLDFKLISEVMQRGRFVATPQWAVRSPGAYEDGGNTLFNVLMRNFGSEPRVMEFGKSSIPFSMPTLCQIPSNITASTQTGSSPAWARWGDVMEIFFNFTCHILVKGLQFSSSRV